MVLNEVQIEDFRCWLCLRSVVICVCIPTQFSSRTNSLHWLGCFCPLTIDSFVFVLIAAATAVVISGVLNSTTLSIGQKMDYYELVEKKEIGIQQPAVKYFNKLRINFQQRWYNHHIPGRIMLFQLPVPLDSGSDNFNIDLTNRITSIDKFQCCLGLHWLAVVQPENLFVFFRIKFVLVSDVPLIIRLYFFVFTTSTLSTSPALQPMTALPHHWNSARQKSI